MSKQKTLLSINQIIPSNNLDCYTSCYCEENVWKLCERVKLNNEELLSLCYAVFISNPNRTVALWSQTAASNIKGLVIWDYHVIFLYVCPKNGCMVYDFDSSLTFPTNFETYVKKTFFPSLGTNEEFHCYFRIINALDYLKDFSSDRRHMRKADKTWISPPPDWPPIQANDCDHNLDKYIDMKDSNDKSILTLARFYDEVSSLSTQMAVSSP